MSASVSKKPNGKARNRFFVIQKSTKSLLLLVFDFQLCLLAPDLQFPLKCSIYNQPPVASNAVNHRCSIGWGLKGHLNGKNAFLYLILGVSGHADSFGFICKGTVNKINEDILTLNINSNIFPETASLLFWAFHRTHCKQFL